MPGHGTGLGAANFPAANKLLMRYEADRAYRMHQQKLANVKTRLDVKEPKKQNHLVLRLKQIQKEEERQAEIDHENKLLLSKMTHIMKYGGSLDNWNTYESRSLNFPHRERVNEEIARENLGIARRLESVRPKLQINAWERDYHKHKYLKRLWNDSVKDFGEFTPRRFRSRMSHARSYDSNLDEIYDDDFESVHTSEDKKLPKLDRSRKQQKTRQVKSETSAPASQRRDDQHKAGSNTGKPAPTKLPKIVPHKADSKKEDGISGNKDKDKVPAAEDKSDVAQLFKIAKQMGKPEEIFIKTLIKKTHKQRMTTKAKFRQKYDLDLVSELKAGLGGPWEYLIDALLQEKGVGDAYAVFDALSKKGGKTSDMTDVVELLCSRNNAGLADLKESYRKEFSLSLEEDITDRSKGPIQTLLLTLQRGNRDESSEVDENEVKKDAVALHESGEGRWESDSGKFMRMLNEKSLAHLRAVFSEFKLASGGQDILEAIKKDTSKDYCAALQTLVRCTRGPSDFYAAQLHKHKLASDPVLVSILVTRSEIDMPQIRKAYKKAYHVDITEEIKAKPHPTQRCLVELASKGPSGSKGGGDKKTATKTGAAGTQEPQNKPPTGAKKQPADPNPESKSSKNTDQKSSQPKSQGNTDGDAAAAKKADSQKKGEGKKGGGGKSGQKEASNNGTVKPAANFNPEEDADRLSAAMSGVGTDERVIVSIIPKRNNKQRQRIKETYEKKFKKNLMIELESELQGDTEEIVLALMMTPPEYDAHVLHEAVDGLGTSEATLIGILATRNAAEMKEIKACYQKSYKADMEKEITRDCQGDLQALMTEVCKGQRESGTAVNMEQASQDAKAIFKNGKLDIAGQEFVDLLSKKNSYQVKATFDEYKKVAGEDIYSSLNKAAPADDAETYISLAKAVEDPVEFYTEKLKSSFTNMGTNDNMLIRIVVSRSEIDLQDIKDRYASKYTTSLSSMVEKECSGDYKDILLAIIDNTSSPTKKSQKQSKQDPNAKPTGGTVKASSNFSPADDCARLKKAMKGFGTDESVMIDIFPKRSNSQRQTIKQKYKELYNEDLEEELKSELRGDFEEIVLAVLMPPADYDAYCLREALDGLGTNEAMLIGILATRTGKELTAVKTRYKEIYGKDLEEDIADDVSGGLEGMLMELLKCQRAQGTSVIVKEAKEDAKRLYKDGQISIDPKDETFKDILVKKNKAQIRKTFEEYKKLTGKDIYYGIQKAFMGDTEDAYMGLAKAVEDTVQFYAESLHKCFDGVGTNDKLLIRVVVTRSEIDLEEIKVRYQKLYKKSLVDSIHNECSGDYKKMLLAMVESQ